MADTDVTASVDPVAGAPSAPAPALACGTRVGRYVLLDPLGEGGMSVVWAAYDPHLDRKVALKLLSIDDTRAVERSRLLREAQALAKLSHANVVGIHDAGIHEGRVFLA